MYRRLAYCVLASICLTSSGCSSGPQGPEEKLVSVRVGEVVQQDVPIFSEVIGTVAAWYSVEIRPQVSGKLLSFQVKEGQVVDEGALIATIDPAPYQAALAKAKSALAKDKAQLKNARQKLERYSKLVEKNFVSQVNIDDYQLTVDGSEAQVWMDQADVETARINLEYCYIRSSIRGRVGRFSVDPGNIVSEASANLITEVRQLNPIEVHFALPQSDYRAIQKRDAFDTMKCQIFFTDSKVPVAEGLLYFVDNHIDAATGTILMKCKVDNEDERLWPGEYVRVRLLARTKQNAILVPLTALQKGSKGDFVYVLKADNTVEIHQVRVEGKLESQAVVEDGLKPGDKVITEGQLNLRAGSKVVIRGEKTP